jgi:cell division protein ZapA
MSLPIASCSLNLLGKCYEIKCPESEVANLQLAGDKLNELLSEQQQKFPHLTQMQLMLMSAVTLSHELLVCQQRDANKSEKVEHAVRLLEKAQLPLSQSDEVGKAIELSE